MSSQFGIISEAFARNQMEKRMGTIEENANAILTILANLSRKVGNNAEIRGDELANLAQLTPDEINDAVTILVSAGLAEWSRVMGTGPYDFLDVWITPRGRYEYERSLKQPSGDTIQVARAISPPTPVGSPYGFTDQDWEVVAERKSKTGVLFVVLGYQFKSEYYESERLKLNIEGIFGDAVKAYNELQGSKPISLDFRALSAGYGEHLFNEIARDIIAADIAVFETSDLNPNVMVEMGVALTWGAN